MSLLARRHLERRVRGPAAHTYLAPTITVPPANATTRAGQPVTLTMTTKGTELRRYEWFKGERGDTSTLVLIYHGGDVSTVTVAPEETTRYWARVSNPCGLQEANPVTVTVTP